MMTGACCSWPLSRGRQPAGPGLTMGNWFPAPQPGCGSRRHVAAFSTPVSASPLLRRVVCTGAAAPTWGACGRRASSPPTPGNTPAHRLGPVTSPQPGCGCTSHPRPRSRAGGAGLQTQDQCQTAASGPCWRLPVQRGCAGVPWGSGDPHPMFPAHGARCCSPRRALAVTEVPEKMHGSAISRHGAASACGCRALGCRRACLVPEDSLATLGDGGAPLAREVGSGSPTALVSWVTGGGDSLSDMAGACGVLPAPRPKPFGRRDLCSVCRSARLLLPSLRQSPSGLAHVCHGLPLSLVTASSMGAAGGGGVQPFGVPLPPARAVVAPGGPAGA